MAYGIKQKGGEEVKHYRLLELLFMSPGIALMFISIIQTSIDGNWFTHLRFGPVVLHSWTAIILGLSYLLSCEALIFLPLVLRNLYAVALVVTGIHLYDVVWGLGSTLSGNGGSPVVPLMGLVGSVILLIWLDFRTMYLQLNRSALIPLAIMVICIGAMAYTGFFHEMSLYSVGLASDPNIGNWWWMISKAAGLIIFPLMTRQGHENREIRWWL